MYIGSTFEPLSKVLIRHKEEYKWYLRGRFTDAHPFELVKYEDAYIELLEDYPCENEKQLRKRKEELIRENKFFENLGKDFYRDMGNIVAEQYIGMSTLELFFDKTLSDIELMKSLFYIIPSKQLYPFKIVWNGDGKEFYDSKYFAHDLDVDDINFYDQ